MFWKEFFPTPKELALQMLQKIDWLKVNNILEPSTWKWDIIDCFNNNRYELSWTRRPEWFWFEIDLNLRKLLEYKCELIWFDFLGFQDTFIEFDAIVMNPPFSNGVDHLLKAWEILTEGQVVCLLNAETVKNPYTQKRKDLVKLIEEHGSVEYVESAFEDAERKTNVEVAIVYLHKKENRYRNIFDGFEDNLNSQYESMFSEVEDNELVKKGDIETLLAYNRIIKTQIVETCISRAKLGHYLKNFKLQLQGGYIDKHGQLSNGQLKEEIKRWVNEINRSCWSEFFQKNDRIRSRTTSKVYKDFVWKFSESTMDFTSENIHFVIGSILGSADEIHKQNMEELFDKFIEYADDRMRESRKTNYGWKIGKKVIIPYMCNEWYNWGINLTYDKTNVLTDIEKVLCTLDAIDFNNIDSAGKLYDYWELETGTWYEFELFKVKFFKKGTMHLTFNNQELVNKFNYEICAIKKWVPQSVTS